VIRPASKIGAEEEDRHDAETLLPALRRTPMFSPEA
jgi:hypothetical protein